MTQKRFILFAVFSLLLLLFVYVKKEGAKKEYFAKKVELLTFEKEAKELAVLKSRYNDKKTTTRLISTLKRIKAPSKDFMKQDIRVLEFEKLDARVLNQLIKKIQNATCVITKLEITRESDTDAKLRVEIKK